MKAYYDQNREPILASKQAQYQANPKEKKSYEVGVYHLGAISEPPEGVDNWGGSLIFMTSLMIYYRALRYQKLDNSRTI